MIRPPATRPSSRTTWPGRVVAIGALAGLIGRERSGAGCHVEVAQVEVTMAVIGDQLLKEALHPGSARPQGNRREYRGAMGRLPVRRRAAMVRHHRPR